MVLLLPDGDDATFFVLVADRTTGSTSFSLFPWRADDSVDIEPNGDAVPEVYVRALTHGIPIPRDGSLFGWVQEDTVTAEWDHEVPRQPEPRQPGSRRCAGGT